MSVAERGGARWFFAGATRVQGRPYGRFYGTSKSISRGLDRGIFSPSLFHQLVDFAVRDVAIQKRMVGTLLQQLVRRIPGHGECSAHDCRTYA